MESARPRAFYRNISVAQQRSAPYPNLMIDLYQRSHMAKLYGYTNELVSTQEPLALRRALAGMEESADRLLRDIRVLVHRTESLR